MDIQSIIVSTALISVLIGIGLGYLSQQSQIKWLTIRHRKLTDDYLDAMETTYPMSRKPEPTKFSAFIQNHKK
jgi:hypothetical protein